MTPKSIHDLHADAMLLAGLLDALHHLGAASLTGGPDLANPIACLIAVARERAGTLSADLERAVE